MGEDVAGRRGGRDGLAAYGASFLFGLCMYSSIVEPVPGAGRAPSGAAHLGRRGGRVRAAAAGAARARGPRRRARPPLRVALCVLAFVSQSWSVYPRGTQDYAVELAKDAAICLVIAQVVTDAARAQGRSSLPASSAGSRRPGTPFQNYVNGTHLIDGGRARWGGLSTSTPTTWRWRWSSWCRWGSCWCSADAGCGARLAGAEGLEPPSHGFGDQHNSRYTTLLWRARRDSNPYWRFSSETAVLLDDSPENLRQRPIHINEGQDQGVPWLSRSQLPLGLRCTMTYGESNPDSRLHHGAALPLSYVPHGGATGLEPAGDHHHDCCRIPDRSCQPVPHLPPG